MKEMLTEQLRIQDSSITSQVLMGELLTFSMVQKTVKSSIQTSQTTLRNKMVVQSSGKDTMVQLTVQDLKTTEQSVWEIKILL